MQKNCSARGRRSWKIVSYCLYYFLSIVVFASVYFVIFLNNTSNFYIPEEYNERCNGRYIVRSTDALVDIQDREQVPFCIDDFNQKVKPVNDEIRKVFNEIDSLESVILQFEEQIDSCQALYENSRDVEQFQSEFLREIKDSVAEFEVNIKDSLLMGIPMARLIMNGTYVQLARLREEYAKENVRIVSHINDNYAGFGSRVILDSLNTMVHLILDMRSEIHLKDESKSKLFNIYEDELRAFHRHRIEKVKFTDFIYFSLLIATSNSFADIMPNSPLARAVSSIQLVFGVIFVAFILDRLLRKDKKCC